MNESNESLLHYACRYDRIDVIRLLIEKYGCDPNAVTKRYEGLLHFACRYDHIDVIKLLIEKYGCDPNAVTKSNESLLHYACQYGHIDVVKYLINEQHLNPLKIKDSVNQLEPLDYAINKNQYFIAVYLCQHISADETLCPNRIKTTINLINYIILRADTWVCSDKWKTADGDNILQLIGNSKICIAHIPSPVVSKILNSHNASCIIGYFKPDLRTADGDSIIEVVYQSRKMVSQISSAVLIKWLSDSTDLKFMKIGTLKGSTADGNNFLELVCQSEKCLIQISSTVFLKWLRKTVLHSVTIAIPDGKTADGDTLLQLILRSEMSISRISSQMLAKLLSNSRKITVNEMKCVNPNWKTVDEVHFPHVLCLSNVENDKVTQLMQYYILENGWNPDTFDGRGNTVLHVACQTDNLALVSYLLDQIQCNPNIENSEGNLPVDMAINTKIINYIRQHSRVSLHSKTITKWLSNLLFFDDTTMLYNTLHSLVYNYKTITADGSTLLHVVCTMSCTSRDKDMLIDYLLTRCRCDPNCLDSKERMPIQLTSDLVIMKKLIDHGAQMTTDVVCKLISMHSSDFRVSDLLKLSTRKGTRLRNPNDLNSDGYTALHLACRADSFTIVNYLLSVAHCDTNVKSKNDEVPIQLTSDLRIMKALIGTNDD